MNVLIIDQDTNCLSLAETKGNKLGMQIDKLQLPNHLPPAIERVKHLSEEFALLFYEIYLAGIIDKYDYVLIDSQWIDALQDGQCRYCYSAFNVLKKMKLVKRLILIRCNGIEMPTFRQALGLIAT